MKYIPDPVAYQLQGVVEEKDEDGEWYSNREYVLSYEKDDAGDVNMRVSDAEPLFTPEQVLMIVDDCDTLQELVEVMSDEVKDN